MNIFKKKEKIIVWNKFSMETPKVEDAPIYVSIPDAKDEMERHNITIWNANDILKYVNQMHGFTVWRKM